MRSPHPFAPERSQVTRIAVISDPHGNDLALNAVLADIRAQGIADILCLGDMVSGPLNAARTADLLMQAGLTAAVRGTHDRCLTADRDQMVDSNHAADAELIDADRNWLGALPATATHGDIFLCHGTPAGDLDQWLDLPGADGRLSLASPNHIRTHAHGHADRVMLCGHSHAARIKSLEGSLLVNPGSVGLSGWRDAAPSTVQTL
jgi:putative phosphoesterase